MNRLEDLKHIYLTPYSHHDHAWTNSRQWHLWRYIDIFLDILDRMSEDPDYVHMIDNVTHSLDAFFLYCPGRAEEFRARVREGRISVADAGMVLARPNHCGDELFLRNIILSVEAYRRMFGNIPLSLFYNVDTSVGHSQMPQILRLTGHNHYRFYRPENALDRTGIPREFVWTGLDGSAITASRGYYGSFLYANCLTDPAMTWEQRKDAFINEDIRDRLPNMGADILFTNVGSDDTYPQRNLFDQPVDIIGFVREWNRRECVPISFVSPYRYVEELNEKTLPVWKGVCDPCDMFFNGPFRSEKSLLRIRLQTERILLVSERLEALLSRLGEAPCQETLSGLWLRLVEQSGHAMQWLLDEDYETAYERGLSTLYDAKAHEQALMGLLSVRLSSTEHPAYIFFNPCAFAREEVVELHITSPDHVKGLVLRDMQGNAPPYQILDTYMGDKTYAGADFNEVRVACRVKTPALGISVVEALRTDADMRPAALREVSAYAEGLPPDTPLEVDNGRLRLILVNGAIRGIWRSRTGETLVPPESPLGLLRRYATRPSDDWALRWDRDALFGFTAEKALYKARGPLLHRICVKGKLQDLPAQIEITLRLDSCEIGYELRFTGSGEEGYYAFALPCDERPRIQAGIPFGAEERDTSRILYSEQMGLSDNDYLYYERGCTGGFFANQFAAFDCGGARLVMTQGDGPNTYRENRDTQEIEYLPMRAFDLRPRRGKWPGHMHPSAQGRGEHSFRFSVLVLERDADTPKVVRQVCASHYPLRTAPHFSWRQQGLSMEGGLIDALPDNLCLTAFYLKDGRYVMRFYETSGKDGDWCIRFRDSVVSAVKTDILLDACHEQGLAVKEKSVAGRARGWEIVTLALVFG